MTETSKPNLKSMAEKWPSSFVAREQIPTFTGGAISTRRIANLDSLKEGPSGRFRLGRKVCYPVSNLIEWLESRATRLN